MAELRIEASMDTWSCIDDYVKSLEKLEDREIKARREELSAERDMEQANKRLAVARTELAEIHLLTKMLAHRMIGDKERLAHNNRFDARRKS